MKQINLWSASDDAVRSVLDYRASKAREERMAGITEEQADEMISLLKDILEELGHLSSESLDDSIVDELRKGNGTLSKIVDEMRDANRTLNGIERDVSKIERGR